MHSITGPSNLVPNSLCLSVSLTKAKYHNFSRPNLLILVPLPNPHNAFPPLHHSSALPFFYHSSNSLLRLPVIPPIPFLPSIDLPSFSHHHLIISLTLPRSNTGGCSGPCTNFYISLNEVINTPGTNCIYNPDSDGGFNLRVCSGANLSGRCSNMQSLPRSDITGDFNVGVLRALSPSFMLF